ncbi:hypothetical protein WOLCODRAFT_101722, partial [Wolfiporia cocos MD-104 SS10]
MMTLSEEVRLIWGRRPTGATIVFLVNRYLVLIFGVAILLQTVAWDTALVMLYYTTNVLLYVIMAVFSALRAYAIARCKWCFALITLALGLVPAVANVYFEARSSYAFVEFINNMPICNFTDHYSSKAYNRVIMASRICAISSDAIVIALTWYYTFKTK